MNDFYQQYITDKSFSLLINLRKKYRFILIGGWAVYFYTNALKSKDIDIIIDFSELEKMKTDFQIEKNERLKKYQIKLEEIDIDIYLPHYSNLGLPVEDIINNTTDVNGFTLLKAEILLITKLTAYINRKNSVKGQKDFIDIVSLLLLDNFNFSRLKSILKEKQLSKYKSTLVKVVKEIKEIPELKLNRHAFSKKKKGILVNLL